MTHTMTIHQTCRLIYTSIQISYSGGKANVYDFGQQPYSRVDVNGITDKFLVLN